MRWIVLICLVGVFTLEAQLSLKAMKKEKRVAFVVVNDSYQELKNDKSSFKKNTINEFLKANGFKTIYLKNATRDEMVQALRKFRDILGEKAIALFYYSGHTARIDDINYLLPIDTLNDYRDAYKMKIELEAILNVMQRFSSRKNIVLIDSADNVTIRKKLNADKVKLSKTMTPKNTDLLASGRSNLISSYLNKNFTYKGLSNKTWFEDFKKINKKSFMKLSNNTFYFKVPNTLKPVKIKPSAEDILWADTVEVNTLQAYANYLAGFPIGKYIFQAQKYVENFEIKIDIHKKIKEALEEKDRQELAKRQREDEILMARLKAKEKRYVEPQMLKIQSGHFKMGCSTCGSYNEMPLHFVRINDAFSIGKYEVSNAEYNLYLIDIKKEKIDAEDMFPVVNVSWDNALAYAQWLSKKTGKKYTLPSEAQWEYVSRAGTTTKYFWGEQGTKFDAYAWGKNNSNLSLHKVGQKEPNKWGLYDLSGNASEWCIDDYRLDYTQKSRNKHKKIVRGGSYLSQSKDLRASFRFYKLDNSINKDIGFRLALNQE
ncbi:SUMF1/EgtB/PvdO family nonheme iron enzyme [Sulfurimonas sp. MAG313]|nr:SUMF1/EgtB/PvdO family nonheme iron enzyme [Sulfurimonas sp. MAG313]MDF1880307.1 SUMF1/EgtB/PvdO family nonheme iron enzyme [Sulfurimonas sp. MAG313]